ncbi:MAG TPA: hypothetical protein VMI32_03765 [Candidatus Solibacter sp.]|nr:hypothetical protein [Candidatus Solibacter sp.]
MPQRTKVLCKLLGGPTIGKHNIEVDIPGSSQIISLGLHATKRISIGIVRKNHHHSFLKARGRVWLVWLVWAVLLNVLLAWELDLIVVVARARAAIRIDSARFVLEGFSVAD